MELKKDRFRKSRGGHSRALALSCAKCGADLFMYQKDGPGILKRLYLDRITGKKSSSKDKLVCKDCGEILGVPMVYKKESRPAFRLFVGSVSKKIISAK